QIIADMQPLTAPKPAPSVPLAPHQMASGKGFMTGIFISARTGALIVAAGVALSGLAIAQTRQADIPDDPFARDRAAPPAGKNIFDAACTACHGEGATGGRGPNLTTGQFQHGGSDFEIFQTIKSGVRGTQMPSFSTLPSDDVWRLVTYIKS